MTEANSAAGRRKRGGTGNFFIVDQRLWKAVCDEGDINAAAAWLLLLQGTGANHRTTAWSVESIKHYLGIGFPRAKDAVGKLLSLGFIRHGEKHTAMKPRYDLLTFAEWSAANGNAGTGKAAAEEDADYSLIWLPNELVTGTERHEKPPIYKVRSSGDLRALRLLVDLYHEHNLRDDGGINRQYIYEEYEGRKVVERGPFTIMGFRSINKCIHYNGPYLAYTGQPKNKEGESAAWESTLVLERAGLLTFVPHLMENESKDAEVIHPFGIGGRSEHELETLIGAEARRAAAILCQDRQLDKALADGLLLCPLVTGEYSKAQLVGIARLHYRPHTKRTSAWSSNLEYSAPGYVEQFRKLAELYAPQVAALA